MATHELKHLISDAPRVMVVDGSKLVRKLISDVLQRELPDVEVVGCASIEEARAALADAPDKRFGAPPPFAIAHTLLRRWVEM